MGMCALAIRHRRRYRLRTILRAVFTVRDPISLAIRCDKRRGVRAHCEENARRVPRNGDTFGISFAIYGRLRTPLSFLGASGKATAAVTTFGTLAPSRDKVDARRYIRLASRYSRELGVRLEPTMIHTRYPLCSPPESEEN